MAITRRPLGTINDITQVDPGVYYDNKGGGYYSGSWDTPNYLGETYTPYGATAPYEGSHPATTPRLGNPDAGTNQVGGSTPYGTDGRGVPVGSTPYGTDGRGVPVGSTPYGTDGRGIPLPTIPPLNNTPPRPGQPGVGPPPKDPPGYGNDNIEHQWPAGSTPPKPYQGPSTVPQGTGVTSVSRPSTTAAPPPDDSGFQGFLQMQLNNNGPTGGPTTNPAQFIQGWNAKYGRTTGNEAVYYPAGSHGPTDRGTIGIPGGYFALNADGTWGWNPRTENAPGPTPRANGPLTWQQELGLVNQQATAARGTPATDAEVRGFLSRYGGTYGQGGSTADQLKPVLDEIDAWKKGPTTPPIDTTTYGGPGGPGVFNTGPTQPVGDDPFSQLLTGGLASIINGRGASGSGFDAGARDALLRTLDRGGQVDYPNQVAAQEAARMTYETARRAQLNNADAALAARGLAGEPGHPQGLQGDAIARIEQLLAPTYTGAVSQNMLDQQQLATSRYNTALNNASQLTSADSLHMLDAAVAGTTRQGTLSDVAIRTLEQNRLFNQFLATYGLDRAKTLYDIQHGQNADLIALLTQFVNQNQITSGGFI